MDMDMMQQMRETDGDTDFIPKQPVLDHLEKIK